MLRVPVHGRDAGRARLHGSCLGRFGDECIGHDRVEHDVDDWRQPVRGHRKRDRGRGSTLTINAGVVVKFNAAKQLLVSGNLSANGTGGSPVVFTSVNDDSADGIDSGGDGATTPAAGDWVQLKMQGAGNTATLDHVDVKYGGSGASYQLGMVVLSNGTLNVSDSKIHASSTSGISVSGSGNGAGTALYVTRTVVEENGFGPAGTSVQGNGLYVFNGYASLYDSAFMSNARDGMFLLDSVGLHGGRQPG